MAFLGCLEKLHNQLVEAYFEASTIAAAAQAAEKCAVIKMQAAARAFLVRLRLRNLKGTVLTVQRYWRGYQGRLRFKLQLRVTNAALRKARALADRARGVQAYFDAHATHIQRWFRGFYSRKYVHSCVARRAYLDTVQRKCAEVRAAAAAEAASTREQQRLAAEVKDRVDFHARIKNMHHLISTAAQPGVLNSPFLAITGTIPEVDGFAVEDHIQAVNRLLVKNLPPLKAARSPKIKDMQLPLLSTELLGNVRKRTLQSLPNYDRPHQEALLETYVRHRAILSHHAVAFTNSGNVPERVMLTQSLRNLEAFSGGYDPTIGNKRELMDGGSSKIANHLFVKSWRPQSVFGNTLRKGTGV